MSLWLSVGSGDSGAKELGGGKPGTGRSEKSAKRASKRLCGCVGPPRGALAACKTLEIRAS